MTAVRDSCFAIMLLWLIKALTAPQITKHLQTNTFDPRTHLSLVFISLPWGWWRGTEGVILERKEMMRIIQYGGSVL